jgi:DUF4097 and DUF4098 domain-containing protein YvlB
MPKIMIVSVLAAAGVCLFAQTPEPRLSCDDSRSHNRRLVSHCEMKEQTLPAPMGAIHINPGQNGGVTVRGWDRADVLMRSRIDTSAPSDAEARQIASQIRLSSGSGQIQADGPDNDRDHNWSVSYEIFAPHNSDIDATAHNGGIHLSDLRGKIQFRAVNGGVTLQHLAGDVQGRTANGGLTVELTGDHWDGAGMNVETTNGGVKLGVPANYSAHVETSTVNGGMNVDFPVTMQGRFSDHELSFNLGAGGAPIRVVTTNGGVRIRHI